MHPLTLPYDPYTPFTTCMQKLVAAAPKEDKLASE